MCKVDVFQIILEYLPCHICIKCNPLVGKLESYARQNIDKKAEILKLLTPNLFLQTGS